MELNDNYLVIDVNQIGYQVYISKRDKDALLPMLNQEITLFIYLHVKEDGHTLFGFSTKQAKEIFLIMLSINGIGPKLAMGVLSELDSEKLVNAVLSNNLLTLTSISGIGKKTAERMVLELKDKFSNLHLGMSNVTETSSSLSAQVEQEVYAALSSLGYSQSEVRKTLSNIRDKITPQTRLEDIITLALRSSSII